MKTRANPPSAGLASTDLASTGLALYDSTGWALREPLLFYMQVGKFGKSSSTCPRRRGGVYFLNAEVMRVVAIALSVSLIGI